MEWMLMPLKRYADFNGRSRRMEYWMFTLGIVIVEIVLFALFGILGAFSTSYDGTPSPMVWPMVIVFVIFGLGLIVPALAVQVRRFHDQDKSGWFVLLGFIPYVGGIIIIVFMCLPGTKGPNKFGPDPIDGGGADLSSTFN